MIFRILVLLGPSVCSGRLFFKHLSPGRLTPEEFLRTLNLSARADSRLGVSTGILSLSRYTVWQATWLRSLEQFHIGMRTEIAVSPKLDFLIRAAPQTNLNRKIDQTFPPLRVRPGPFQYYLHWLYYVLYSTAHDKREKISGPIQFGWRLPLPYD